MSAAKVCELEGCEVEVSRRGARFCSRAHGYAGQGRPGRTRGEKCAAGLHDMAGGNLRVDKTGRRSCKWCAAIAKNKRKGYAPPKPGNMQRPKARKPKPEPRPAPVAPVPERAPWRPAGFSPAPVVRREAS